MKNDRIAAAFFHALATEDEAALRDVCTPDFQPQQNGGAALSIGELLGFARAVHGAVEGFSYAEPVCAATAGGFVQEHRIRGTLPGGTRLDLPVCVVGDVRDGRLSAAREYFDTASAAELIAALR